MTLSFQVVLAQNTAVLSSQNFDVNKMLHDVEILSADDMLGRKVGSPGGMKAREYVLNRFKESGLISFDNSYLQPFEATNEKNERFQGANVIGYIKGLRNPSKYIVVTAHYDHLGIKNGEVYNGADDNASGTAALFALAEYFVKNKPANSIIFVAFDAEERIGKSAETALQGSKHFVSTPPVNRDSMIVNVNLDMVSHSFDELYAAGPFHYPFLKPYLEEIAKTAKIKLLFGHDSPKWNPPGGEDQDWTDESDHFHFHLSKIPFVYFGVEDHRDYHKPTDDFEHIDREYKKFYVPAVELILLTVKTFDEKLTNIEKQKAALPKN
jgi:hypothetical protein